MSPVSQAARPIAVQTPLGEDALLLVGLQGQEGISQLFRFTLDLIAENGTDVPFDQVLGQPVAVRIDLPDGSPRFIHGLCSRISQGESDEHFTSYQMEMVPALWLLTRRVQSRIFQHMNVPDILKKVFEGLQVDYEIMGTFHPRDYCTQYRESDFDFAARTMEEEGIYYFFKHSQDGHRLVVANTPQTHPDMPFASEIVYRSSSNAAAQQVEDYIQEWSKTQSLTSGKVTLWDHCFELPGQHLDSERPILDSVQMGMATHKLKVADNTSLEIYDYPGGYAQRFDGVDKGGADQPAEVEKIFEDNARTTGIRMQEEAMRGLLAQGSGNCRQMVSGHKFMLMTLPFDLLTKHLMADGAYVLTQVTHRITVGSNYRSGDWSGTEYQNRFEAIPFALPFRPARSTPRPTVKGSQTATVVGPDGEEIFTDKYGRVKAQLNWDREGKYDIDSSCWIRVGTVWAGKGFGMIHIPRVGQEVIVDFLEGDPDQPLIVGSVYNADQMPALDLPKERMISGFKSNTYPGGGGYNSLLFDDTKDKEMITLHGQYDMATTIEHDETITIHNDRTIKVDGKFTETITKDTKITIEKGPYDHIVQDNKATFYVKGDVKEDYEATQKTTVKSDITITSVEGEITITAAKKITLHTGDSKITLEANGKISIDGANISITGTKDIKESAPAIDIAGQKETKYGVGAQTVTCDPAKVVVSGAGITSTAVGMHEISGAMVKIN